jgi:hypothetical protein
MHSYSLSRADNFVATSGHQTISFAFSPLQQRIDRSHTVAGSALPSFPAP